MSMRYPGGFIASTPVTAGYPSGVWTQAQAIPYQAQNVWTRDQFWPYTTLLLQGDGAVNGAQNNTFLDSSSNNFTITRNGNTTQGSFTPYEQDGYWSNYFDGTGDYLRVADSTAFDLPGDFTLEFWIYPTASGFGVVLGSEDSGQNGFVVFNGTNMGVYGNGASIISVSSAIVLNAWQHIAVVRSGTSLKFYLNGTERGSATNSTSFTGVAGNGFAVAATYTNTYITSGTGYFSNVRLVKSAVYTTNFTPPTAPLTAITNTSLLTCQSNRFIDNSTNAFAITRNGDVSVQAFQPFPGATTYSGTVLGGSGYFDGSGDSLTRAFTSTTDGMYPQGTTYTVEAWVYPTAISGYIYVTEATNTSNYGTWKLYIGGSSQFGFDYRPTTGGTYTTVASSAAVALNSWYHVAVSVSAGSARLFVNGTQVGSTTTISAISFTPVGATVGNSVNGFDTAFFTGYISNLKITQGTANYTSNFTPPSSPLTGGSLLLNFTNAGISDAAVMNDLETVGNAQVSTSVVKYGTGSMAFDGSGDYLRTPDGPNTELGSGDFTLECWVNFNSLPASNGHQATFVSKWATNNASYEFYLYNNAGTQQLYLTYSTNGTASTNLGVNWTPATGVWYHIACVRNGGNLTFWVNGTQQGATQTISGTLFDGSAGIEVGGFVAGSANTVLNGYIDDLRITKAARYLTSFTPPPARMPGQ
jgi:hypothetical protein